jgi:hypothetical protein
MLPWSQALFDALITGVHCTDCGVVSCSPWQVKVISGLDGNGNRLDDAYLHDSRTLSGDHGVPIAKDSILEVTSTSSSGGTIALFVTVVTSAKTGRDAFNWDYAVVGATGWIASFRTEYLSGTATGLPYVLPRAGGRPARDGSAEAAVAYAMSWVGTGAAEWGGNPPAETSKCLGFVKACYGLGSSGAADRCPALGGAGSAFAAHAALAALGRIHTDSPPPPGAMIFWNGSDKNGGWGHVAVMGMNGMVITSGAVSSHPEDQADNPHYHPDVWTGTLDEVTDWTGPYLGYALVDEIFLPGTWGGYACTAPDEEEA